MSSSSVAGPGLPLTPEELQALARRNDGAPAGEGQAPDNRLRIVLNRDDGKEVLLLKDLADASSHLPSEIRDVLGLSESEESDRSDPSEDGGSESDRTAQAQAAHFAEAAQTLQTYLERGTLGTETATRALRLILREFQRSSLDACAEGDWGIVLAYAPHIDKLTNLIVELQSSSGGEDDNPTGRPEAIASDLQKGLSAAADALASEIEPPDHEACTALRDAYVSLNRYLDNLGDQNADLIIPLLNDALNEVQGASQRFAVLCLQLGIPQLAAAVHANLDFAAMDVAETLDLPQGHEYLGRLIQRADAVIEALQDLQAGRVPSSWTTPRQVPAGSRW